MKLDRSSIKQILIRFKVCPADTADDSITDLRSIRPLPTTVGFKFNFNKRPMWLIFDEDAHDDLKRLARQTGLTVNDVTVYPNPKLPTSFGLPILSKTAYLIEQTSLKQRLDQKLQTLHPDMSRAKLQKLIKQGSVLVNGEKITTPSRPIGDEKIILQQSKSSKQPREFKILYEDDEVLVIDKPIGVLSHAKPSQDSEWTIEDFARQHSQVVDGSPLAHRLDRLTSGVIVAAKTQKSLDNLKQQFKNRQVKKIYYALVADYLPHQEAMVDLPLARSVKFPQRFQVDPSGRPAQTKYQIIRSDDETSLVKLEPITGRTHQLRAHLAYLNSPIVGDDLYDGIKADRLMLHASQIEFKNLSGETIVVNSPPPKELRP